MLRRVLSALMIWTLIVGCCLAFSDQPPQASQNAPAVAAPSPAPREPAPRAAPALPTAGEQMHALDRHARKNMICYTGRLNRADLATIKKEITPVAPGAKGALR